MTKLRELIEKHDNSSAIATIKIDGDIFGFGKNLWNTITSKGEASRILDAYLDDEFTEITDADEFAKTAKELKLKAAPNGHEIWRMESEKTVVTVAF